MDSVIITNTGTSDLIISSFSSSNSQFALSASRTIITPGSSRKFYITFTPLAPGHQDGYIFFNDNSPNTKDSIRVTGTSYRYDANGNITSLLRNTGRPENNFVNFEMDKLNYYFPSCQMLRSAHARCVPRFLRRARSANTASLPGRQLQNRSHRLSARLA